MIHEFKNPIPVVTELGDGYAIYVKSSGMFENDEWCITLKESGEIRHFLTSQIKISSNSTYQIRKSEK